MSSALEKRWYEAVGSIEHCVLCGGVGEQIAHRNEGKGMGLKTKPWMTARLCRADHEEIDSGRHLDRSERRARMDRAITLTHDLLITSGRLRLA